MVKFHHRPGVDVFQLCVDHGNSAATPRRMVCSVTTRVSLNQRR
jgi:hypothetical protein